MNSGPTRLLDLTRTVSRLGRGSLTGIDRVELAYLEHFLTQPEPVFCLVRTALGFVLLDRVGAGGLLNRVLGNTVLGHADKLALLTLRHLPQNAKAESEVRRLAVGRCLPMRLAAMLRRALPAGTTYVNVGHANVADRVMRAVKSVPDAKVMVMVHDTIPIDYPQYCRPGMQAVFAQKLAVISRYADGVIHTARCTGAQTENHFTKIGRVPRSIVAPLGIVLARPDAAELAQTIRPYFVVLGTIEPRKNIELLVKVWRELQNRSGPVPHLYVIGNKGWAAASLFDALNELAAGGTVTLLHNLSDNAVVALLQGAQALLFPSLAEGYGLPPLEAAALGVPVIASKLPVVVELLADYPVYLDTSDVYAWVDRINDQMTHRTPKPNAKLQIQVPPSWSDHFAAVFQEG